MDTVPPSLAPPPPLPRFSVQLEPPDLSPWLDGNTGVRGVMQFAADRPGPHVVLTSLMHGNEFAGAIVLDELLRQGFRPRRGRLTIGFLNLAAFARFDPRQPTASRFVDEDMNRLWDDAVLDSARVSAELVRAREVRPVVQQADILLDLHSMLWPSEPLILGGPSPKGLALGRRLGVPPIVIADAGHRSGPRLIDYAPFAGADTERAACLLEAGPHWEPATVDTARQAVASLLRSAGLSDDPAAPQADAKPRLAEVTHVVTAATGSFSFVRPFRGGEVIPDAGTLIATDGVQDIRTPYDECLLVMPSLRPSRGHTAVRLGRFLLPDEAAAVS